jgi:hypothetical protein
MVLHEVATAAIRVRASGNVVLFIVADRLVDSLAGTLQPDGAQSSLFLKLAE